MPTYEYECKSCFHTFEAFQAMSDEPIKICPQCGREVRRLIYGGAGVIFKGSGFYVTDKNKSSSLAQPEKKTAGSAGTAPAAPAPDTAAQADKSPSGGKPAPETARVREKSE